MSEHAAYLKRKISSGNLHVGVVGLGYVGLPLALAFVERANLRVTGFDVDSLKVDKLNRGETYIRHLGPDRVRRAQRSGSFSATCDLRRLSEPDVIMIAVPTPLGSRREPDMQYVVATADAIAKALRPGQLILLESTTYPGTTEDLIKPILDASGLKCKSDYFLAFSPEREDPGNQKFNTTMIPKIVGGVDDVSRLLAVAVYSLAFERVVPVQSARVAEAAKLTENIFRGVNIALVNELKMVYERMGINIWDVLDAASTKPFGYMRFDPGPGWGGHCIPVDPFYLAWKARELGVPMRFVELAGEINLDMPHYVVERLKEGLSHRQKSIERSKVLILGIAYKKDIDDPRESPSFELMRLLLAHSVEVEYHDPHIAVTPRMRSWTELPRLESRPLTKELLNAQDAVIISTDHSIVDYALVLDESHLVVDTRGVYKEPHPHVIRA